MRVQVFWGSMILFLLLVPAVAFPQNINRGEFSKDTEKLFMSESATLADAEKVVNDLYSPADHELARGLYFSSFVAPRFPSLREKIESKLVQIINNSKEKRFFQAVETALSIMFSKENAERLLYNEKEFEINLVKALIKEKAGVKMNISPETIISQIEKEKGSVLKPLLDENSLKESFLHCTLFREIIDIASSMKFTGVTIGFSRIVVENPINFDKDSIIFATEILKQKK